MSESLRLRGVREKKSIKSFISGKLGLGSESDELITDHVTPKGPIYPSIILRPVDAIPIRAKRPDAEVSKLATESTSTASVYIRNFIISANNHYMVEISPEVTERGSNRDDYVVLMEVMNTLKNSVFILRAEDVSCPRCAERLRNQSSSWIQLITPYWTVFGYNFGSGCRHDCMIKRFVKGLKDVGKRTKEIDVLRVVVTDIHDTPMLVSAAQMTWQCFPDIFRLEWSIPKSGMAGSNMGPHGYRMVRAMKDLRRKYEHFSCTPIRGYLEFVNQGFPM